MSEIFIGIAVCIGYDVIKRLLVYLSDQEAWKRKRLKACKIAIYNLIDRFNIDQLSSNQWSVRMVTPETNKWVLFETLMVLNNTNGKKQYPDETDFKKAAESWYNDNTKNGIDIQFYTQTKINELLLEISSWNNPNGRPWIYERIPTFVKLWVSVKNWVYAHRSVTTKLNKFLYSGSSLPRNNYTNQTIISMLSENRSEKE